MTKMVWSQGGHIKRHLLYYLRNLDSVFHVDGASWIEDAPLLNDDSVYLIFFSEPSSDFHQSKQSRAENLELFYRRFLFFSFLNSYLAMIVL